MKKTLILTLALGLAANISLAAVDVHNTHFDNIKGGPQAGIDTPNKMYQTTDANYLGGATVFRGFYVGNGTGLKLNLASDVNTTYLYLGSQVEFANYDTVNANYIAWSSGKLYAFAMQGSGWVDVDRVYDRINLSHMSNGTVYLNTHGQLKSSGSGSYTDEKSNTGSSTWSGYGLASGNTVLADVNLDLADIAAYSAAANGSIYTKQGIGDNLFLVTRTLLVGDYSKWTGTVGLTNASVLDASGEHAAWGHLVTSANDVEYNAFTTGDYSQLGAENIGAYYVFKDGNSLKVAYVIPEPATATLSLLALAGLAARRRRK